jgi:general secretion pathway protein C
MLRAIVHTLRSRAPRSLPCLVSIALAALVAVESVRLSWQFLLLAQGSPEEFEARSAHAATVRAHQWDIDVARITAAHLFGVPAAAPVKVDAADVPVTAANLVLTGTLASANPKRGVAIVRDDGKSAVYEVGASLGGAVVASIYADRVVLDRGGTLEALLMPRQIPADGSMPVAGASQGGPAAVADGNAGGISVVMRAGGSVTNEAGRVRGFRIYPGRDRSTFGAAGFHGGDLVVAVNGTSVLEQNSQSGQELFQTIANLARATMTIERNGQTHDVTVDVAQAGTSMNPVAAVE